MKKLFTLVLLSFAINSLFAQKVKSVSPVDATKSKEITKNDAKDSKKEEKKYNVWSVNLNAGTNVGIGPWAPGYFGTTANYFTNPDINHVDFNVRKMFNTKFGMILDLGYDNFDADTDNGSKPFSNNMYRTSLQGVINIHRALNFEEFTNRFGLQFHFGPGFSYLQAPSTTTFSHYDNIFSIIGGSTLLIRINNKFALSLDYTATRNLTHHRSLDGTKAIGPENSRTGQVLSTSMGLTYYIGKKERHADWYWEDPKEKVNDLLTRIENLENKLKDTDGDGIIDSEDGCVNAKGQKVLRKDGCPDTDGDTIPDCDDKCPTVKGAEDNLGCPWPDADGDGIADKDDKCPTVKGEVKNAGCPMKDLDGDGVLDFDNDGDDVPDNKDKCPTVKGLVAYNGCLEVPAEDLMRLYDLAKVILFNVDKYSFQQRSYRILNEVVAFMKEYPNANFSIEGHTDSDNTDSYNMTLSKNRVTAVKNYLAKAGINASRLKITWHGESRPIDTNTTKAGKANNRRVEIKFIK